MGSCYSVTETQQVIVQTLTTEEVINGPHACIYLTCLKSGTKREANMINEKQYVYIDNAKDGSKTILKGPGLVFLKPFERIDGDVQNAVPLKPNEYAKIINTKTGSIRVEKGEKLLFLDPFEQILGDRVQQMAVVDRLNAVLMRDITTGVQTLITEPQMYTPSPVEEVLSTQKLVVLKYYEVMVLLDPQGNFVFKHGWINTEGSFFVPPYHSILQHKWTKSSVRKALSEGNKIDTILDEEVMDRIDIRHRFMSYAFVARTHDNVEIILDIVFGWQIVDAEKMINKTKDTKNDICLKARSEIIEKVAKLPFRTFMQEVNAVVESAVLQADTDFYIERGILVTSIQVEGFSCKHPETEKVLQETVQEATNKINRILKQETANEVIKVEMAGKIKEEELKKRVLEIQYEHEQIVAKTDGEAASGRVRTFLQSLGNELSLEQKLMVFNTLEKKESIKELARGSGVTLFCTPQDVNLNLGAFGSMDGMPALLTNKARNAEIEMVNNVQLADVKI